MADLTHRQTQLQEKRKQTSFREYLMEIASWFPVVFHRHGKFVSRYPNTPRCDALSTYNEFFDFAPTQTLDHYKELSFWEHIQKLRNRIPKPNLVNFWGTENAEYADSAWLCKNVYLSTTVVIDCENVLYSNNVKENSANVLDSLMVRNNNTNICMSRGVLNSSNIFYSSYINNSYEIRFSRNLTSCQECINCDNLTNQSYCINNIQLSKEDYQTKKAELLKQNVSFDQRNQAVIEATAKEGYYVASENVQGGFIFQCRDVERSYYTCNVKDGKNLILVGGGGNNEHCYDLFSGASTTNDYLYGCVSLWGGSSHIYCSAHILKGNNIFHSYLMRECSYCLWCVGLTNKSYCIFNKEYSKEERHAKVDEIFGKMEKDWTLWQFFPPTMNPFYFNDTASYLIDPTFTKEEVEAAWYLRRDEPIKVDIPANAELVKTSELDNYEWFDENGKWTINEEILKKVIVDETWNMWRIVNMEYAFLVKYGLPLPRKHWLERMKENFKIA